MVETSDAINNVSCVAVEWHAASRGTVPVAISWILSGGTMYRYGLRWNRGTGGD